MHHLPHLSSFSDSPIVFFTVCTYQRFHLLANQNTHEIIRGVWERSSESHGWFVGDYVLMPDHVHFFARASRDADTMARWIGMWKSVSSRQIARACSADKPIWQAEYFDRYLRSDESYHEKWSYVEQNPVRGGLVSDSTLWPYRGCVYQLSV